MNAVTKTDKKLPESMAAFIKIAEERGLKVIVIDESDDWYRVVKVKVTRDDLDPTSLASIIDAYESYYMNAMLSLSQFSTNRWHVTAYESDYNVPFHKIPLKAAVSGVRFGFHGIKKVGA